MARRVRVGVEGGLYHLITRGVERQDAAKRRMVNDDRMSTTVANVIREYELRKA